MLSTCQKYCDSEVFKMFSGYSNCVEIIIIFCTFCHVSSVESSPARKESDHSRSNVKVISEITQLCDLKTVNSIEKSKHKHDQCENGFNQIF